MHTGLGCFTDQHVLLLLPELTIRQIRARLSPIPSLTVGAERGERGQAGPGLGRECFAYPTLFVRRLVIRTNIPLTGNSLTLSSNPALINYWKLELGNQVRIIFFTFLLAFLWNKKKS